MDSNRQLAGKKRRREITAIEDKASRKVSACKRRDGLFHKITGLHSTTGHPAASIVISSASGTCWACGSPSIDHVLDLILPPIPAPGTGTTDIQQLLETSMDGWEDLERLLNFREQLLIALQNARNELKLMS